MNDQTDTFTKTTDAPPKAGGPEQTSKAFSMSIRAWIALIFVFTVCIMSGLDKTIEEPLKSLALIAVSFYFGQNKQPGKS